MRFRTAVLLVLTLAVTIATATLQGAATPSRQQADSLARKITQITQRASQGPAKSTRRTEVSEDEVNTLFRKTRHNLNAVALVYMVNLNLGRRDLVCLYHSVTSFSA
jgi:hypothetical protein